MHRLLGSTSRALHRSPNPNYRGHGRPNNFHKLNNTPPCQTYFWSGFGNQNDDNNDDEKKNIDAEKEAKEAKEAKEEKDVKEEKDAKEESASPLHGKGVNRGKSRMLRPWTLASATGDGMDMDMDMDGGGMSGGGASLVGNGGVMLPSRMGLGDESPRYPNLIGIPVLTRPLFPGYVSSVNLTNTETIDALENLTSKGTGYVGVFLRTDDGRGENKTLLKTPEIITDPSQIHDVGTFAQIYSLKRGPSEDHLEGEHQDSATLLLMAHRRINLLSVDNLGPPIDMTVKHWCPPPTPKDEDRDILRALTNEIVTVLREVAQTNILFREHLALFSGRIDLNDPVRLADFVAMVTTGTASPAELQAVLQESDPIEGLKKTLALLTREREVGKLQREISAQVEEKMTEAQRKYFLTEQLKSIKKELGMEMDDKDALIDKYQKIMEENEDKIPAEVLKVMKGEVEKLSTLEKNSAEFNVTRTYLDWLTVIPYGVFSEDKFHLKHARRVLDRDHYGLDDVKDLILQFIAIGKLKGSVQGKILCLSGPPGTGKTSIASSIAEALGRKFYRFSVGGLGDVSEIKGHRRTYVGSMPGKFIQCLKTTGTANPLILIDEIDKLGKDFRGDPASALLEVLDPSQNQSFVDHFLDVPVDFSKVLFMCTANDINRIPAPLLDRMEIVSLSGYDVPEKINIAHKYLLPKSLRESGLLVAEEAKDETDNDKDAPVEDTIYIPAKGTPKELHVDKSAIEQLVRWYCREAGVRNLRKHIDKITRKLALQIVAEGEGTSLSEKTQRNSSSWVVDKDNLHEYVGQAPFTSDRMYEDSVPPGIVMGLAWTSMGGSALYVETRAVHRRDKKGGGTLKITGRLGEVMTESVQIAFTLSRNMLAEIDPKNDFFDQNAIHVHVPEGATPKDGPSAGITIVSSMLSLALNRPVKNDVAMTGEVSLSGKVLPVGGIKEKIVAARRAGVTCLILPVGCKNDYDELSDYLKDGLDVTFADMYHEVFDVIFEKKEKEEKEEEDNKEKSGMFGLSFLK